MGYTPVYGTDRLTPAAVDLGSEGAGSAAGASGEGYTYHKRALANFPPSGEEPSSTGAYIG
jgi:hypothetical protein